VLGKDEFTGKQFGRFEVLCKLGDGGMSEVFLAWQKSVGGFRRAVVLKRILATIRHDKEFLRMFLQEAKITSGLSHGNIAALHDLSREANELFMVMEFVAGATLLELVVSCAQAKSAIPLGFTLAVVRDTALALHYAHQFKDSVGRPRPVIHRDIAEKNIMVSFDGTTKLLDFGIARQQGRAAHTQVGMVKGTAGYMSPEQVKGEDLDGRTDVFSLGVVLHECLTGMRLFHRANRSEEVEALLHEPIAPPSQRARQISPELDGVVLKALARDRSQRFATARELAIALERAGTATMWDAEQRGAFIQRQFASRQKKIQELLGDPGKTDLGDLLDSDQPPSLDDAAAKTIFERRPSAEAIAAASAGPGSTVAEEEEEEAQQATVVGRGDNARSRSTGLNPKVLAIAGGAMAALLLLLLVVLWSKL
jgi:serine/threonine protein kinase